MSDAQILAALQRLADVALHLLTPEERALVRGHLGRMQEATRDA